MCLSIISNSSRDSFSSRRKAPFSCELAPSASRNCSGVARNPLSAIAASTPGSVSPSASAFNIRRALTPRRSDTKLDNLMCPCSNRLSSWFLNPILARVNWYFRRVTVRKSRCSSSGTKLKTSSSATSRFTILSASRKSFLRPRGPWLLLAWHRWSVPDFWLAPSRCCRAGLQNNSSVPHTGLQYGGRFHDDFFDLQFHQPLGQHVQFAGGGAEFTAFKLILACPFHVGHDNCQHPLVNVNGCYSIRHHASPWRRGEHAKRYSQAGSRGYRRSQQGDDRRPIIRAEAQHAPGSNRPTISTSPLSSRPHRSTFAMIPVFHGISRAEGPFKQTTKNDGLSHKFLKRSFG